MPFPAFSNIMLGLQPVLKLMSRLLPALQIEFVGSLLNELLLSLDGCLATVILFGSRCQFHNFFNVERLRRQIFLQSKSNQRLLINGVCT